MTSLPHSDCPTGDCQERLRLAAELVEPIEFMAELLKRQRDAAQHDNILQLVDCEARLRNAAQLRERAFERLQRHLKSHVCVVIPSETPQE